MPANIPVIGPKGPAGAIVVVVNGSISKQSSGQFVKSSPSSHTSLPQTASGGMVVVGTPLGSVVVVVSFGQSLGHICGFSHGSHTPFNSHDLICPITASIFFPSSPSLGGLGGWVVVVVVVVSSGIVVVVVVSSGIVVVVVVVVVHGSRVVVVVHSGKVVVVVVSSPHANTIDEARIKNRKIDDRSNKLLEFAFKIFGLISTTFRYLSLDRINDLRFNNRYCAKIKPR